MYYQRHDYPAAYVLSPQGFITEGLRGCRKISIGHYELHHSEEVKVHSFSNSTTDILLVGYCFDIRDGQLGHTEIMEKLSNSVDLPKELEFINGRYFLIMCSEEGCTLYSDASQLQPLVYHEASASLASHDHLLASILSGKGMELVRRPGEGHTELDFTRYEEIFKVNPSLRLSLDTFDFERIYPRADVDESDAEYSFEQMKPYLEESRQWLSKAEGELFLTLTAGIDSRVSAALIRPLRERVEFLTYYTPSKYLATRMAKIIHKIDRNVAEQMKDDMGWRHSIINIRDYKPDAATKEEWVERYNSRHAYGLINYYRHHKNYKHALHIKSTVFGMGKADFKPALDDHEDTLTFYRKCIHGLSKTFERHYDEAEEVEKYFKRNHVYEGVTKGRHYFDLFHLESRMGNWHSTLTLETDPEVDEFIFMNARRMIDLMQQPSIDERRNFSLYKKIINHYWPVLLHFGINSEKNLYEQYCEEAREMLREPEPVQVPEASSADIREVRIMAQDSMILEKKQNEDSVLLKPGAGMTNAHNVNSFVIENGSKEARKVRLKSFYSNPKGKGIIKVVVRTSQSHEVYDILSLNTPLEIEITDTPYSVIVLYNENFSRASWQEAGTLQVEVE
ncbi:hypothetical protein [Salinicoccus roseus]|uniref:hypothetical protein n=3 Tax=Salinicoccus roseus TaxID=45670 RepID=UPI000F4F93F6|nr:hypothetical protein [Salinicoccus roseus]RPE54813.1 hypothetical protein EDC33_1076 [Salinicoccus roseus]